MKTKYRNVRNTAGANSSASLKNIALLTSCVSDIMLYRHITVRKKEQI